VIAAVNERQRPGKPGFRGRPRIDVTRHIESSPNLETALAALRALSPEERLKLVAMLLLENGRQP